MIAFSNNDSNMLALQLRKSVYPYEYMDDWETFEHHHYLKIKNFKVPKI